MREYLLYCTYCDEYSALGHYVEKEGHFEGEYSLLHNERMQSDELLCRFLLCHLGHHIKAIPNRTDEFSDILKSAKRFKDGEIDKYVEEALLRKQAKDKDMEMDRELGKLQLNVLCKMLEEEAQVVAKLPTETKAEAQFLLGKEEGLKRALILLQDLMEKTRAYYK
ncbi:hypothetical protein [Ammoniphilus sp. YIM 78166]|uniref:hypothetical protein n=1 Tax=Ammoniphilus sp. YIM 78166 TaxID=1644106 RepID=UPI00106F0DF6|nr:hypothetical protein [Ammoniphilus sp. YIM 78166]